MAAAYLPVQPVNFIIPPDIQAGIDLGELVRWGGVVRNRLGHIVTHLKEAPALNKDPAAAQRAAAILKDKRVVTVLVLTSVAGGAVTFLAVKERRRAKRCVQALNASLIAYLEAARDGRLDEDAIDRLLSDLRAAESYSQNGQVAVATALVNLVVDYTSKLAEANSVDLSDLLPAGPSSTEGGSVVELRHHLEAQKKIFKDVA